MENNTPQEIYDFLKTVKNPVQFIDSRIDADALCSAIALSHVLRNHFGINLTLCYSKHLSHRYIDQLDGFVEVPEIFQNVSPKNYDFTKHDCLICTDTGSLAHLSEDADFARPANLKILNIDHHSSNNGYGDLNYVKVLGAACAVVYELFKKWRVQPEKQVANALLMGIMLDTGHYCYNTTTPQDFLYSSELIELGAEHYGLTWRITFNETEDDVKLKKLIYANLVINRAHKVAYTTISQKELQDLNLKLEDSFIAPSDVIKKITGIDFAFTAKEISGITAEYNISLRSHHEKFNCLELAKSLNPASGGHVMAAGCNISANSMQEAVKMVLEKAAEFKSQDNS